MAWAKFPTQWILAEGLTKLTWGKHRGDATAALLILVALAIQRNLKGKTLPNGLPTNDETAVATYDKLQTLTGLSRAKVAAAIRLLVEFGVIERGEEISSYRLLGVGVDGGWAKLPQTQLLVTGSLFHGLSLRNQTELDGLKLYLFFVAGRSQKSGYAHVGYSKLTDYTGVQANRIRRAKSFLIANDLIHAENDPDAYTVQGRRPLRYKVIGL